jgi:hypothetical protein
MGGNSEQLRKEKEQECELALEKLSIKLGK